MLGTFRSPGSDGSEAHEIPEVLGGEVIEEFHRGRYPHRIDLKQQLPRDSEAFLYIAAIIEIRVVYQSFPPDRGPRLFEIGPHD